MKQRWTSLWAVNFAAAVVVLLALKYGLVLNNVFGTEAFEPAYKAIPKSLLFLGHDILSAAVFAALVALVCLPWLRRPGSRVVIPLSATLQAAHAFVATVSFFGSIYAGGLVTKSTLDLTLLQQPSGPGGEAPAIWSSVAPFLNAVNLGTLVVTMLLAVLAVVYAPRLLGRLSRRAKRILAGVLAVEAALTVFLLPFLFTGVIGGLRVRSEGLERSPIQELAWSYVKPVAARIFREKRHFDDPFRLDLTSPFPPAEGPLMSPLAAARPQRSNVVIIVLESIGQVYLNDKPELMPFLTGVGKQPGGVYFANHYTTWAMTIKASFSLFCSEHPYADWERITVVNPAIPCRALPDVAHDAGYFTAVVTSGDLAYDRRVRFLLHHDLDVTMDMRTQPGRDDVWRDSWGVEEPLTIRNLVDVVRHRNDPGAGGAAERPNGERGAEDRPFLVFYEMAAGHHPYVCCHEHERDPIGDELESYERALRYVDDRIREVYETFQREGLAENTLFVVVSDHGEGFGQHPGSVYHGAKVYQETALVPFAMFGPQLAGVSGEVRYPTSHIDFAPTILGLLGLDVPCTMKGRDLTKAPQHNVVLVAGRAPGEQYGLVDDRWKYIVDANGSERLFDLAADPGEKTNAIAQQPQRAEVYRRRVADWRVFSIELIENYAEILAESACGSAAPGAPDAAPLP